MENNYCIFIWSEPHGLNDGPELLFYIYAKIILIINFPSKKMPLFKDHQIFFKFKKYFQKTHPNLSNLICNIYIYTK